MAPDGLMIGTQGPAHTLSPGGGSAAAAEGSQLPGGGERRWGLAPSRVIRTAGHDTAPPCLSVPPSLQLPLPSPAGVGKYVTILS